MILLGAMMQRLVTRRLAQLEAVTHRLEVGDLTARTEISGNDEVASLARGFNRMAAIVQNHSQLVRLNQIYAALSQTNETIVRVENEAELLNRICRIAVEFGGARLA
jgi:HAMP domain-containing protein